ncbi:hypothetical protein MAPG_10274 [Magnaporthiopsis poae ATCC 64411]|uniref:Uncharacterized protein n=1 Tax=Magnaporthiopsis poae (strain ATCC 64411 / 73-15) TaxID=644358 RepID=A0A0C4EC60_MAGP6|nr:hypothetical protein MAPG_10274 [Magnaporthiopsis poae ATCC 64411]
MPHSIADGGPCNAQSFVASRSSPSNFGTLDGGLFRPAWAQAMAHASGRAAFRETVSWDRAAGAACFPLGTLNPEWQAPGARVGRHLNANQQEVPNALGAPIKTATSICLLAIHRRRSAVPGSRGPNTRPHPPGSITFPNSQLSSCHALFWFPSLPAPVLVQSGTLRLVHRCPLQQPLPMVQSRDLFSPRTAAANSPPPMPTHTPPTSAPRPSILLQRQHKLFSTEDTTFRRYGQASGVEAEGRDDVEGGHALVPPPLAATACARGRFRGVVGFLATRHAETASPYKVPKYVLVSNEVLPRGLEATCVTANLGGYPWTGGFHDRQPLLPTLSAINTWNGPVRIRPWAEGQPHPFPRLTAPTAATSITSAEMGQGKASVSMWLEYLWNDPNRIKTGRYLHARSRARREWQSNGAPRDTKEKKPPLLEKTNSISNKTGSAMWDAAPRTPVTGNRETSTVEIQQIKSWAHNSRSATKLNRSEGDDACRKQRVDGYAAFILKKI